MQEEAILNLKWDSFSSQLTNSLDACYEKQYFVDLSLVCKNGTILKCHKMVLSNASSFFRRLLVKNDHPHPMIILHDVEADDLKTIVNFMYCGEIRVVKSEVKRILKIAETLEVSGLKDIRSTILIPEDNSLNHKNPRKSTDTECPLKITDARSPTAETNVNVDTIDTVSSRLRKKAPNGTKKKCFNSDDNHTKSRYDLTKKNNVDIGYDDNVGMYRPSTSRATSEESKVVDTSLKSSSKRTNVEGQISWNKVLSEISKEDHTPLKRLCLMNEVEITTAISSRTESHSRSDVPVDDTESTRYEVPGVSSSSEPRKDCGIYIKDEVDIPSDSEWEFNTSALERHDRPEQDTSNVDRPVETFKRLQGIGGPTPASEKYSSDQYAHLFELFKQGPSG